jgi:hypothetical protein
MRPLAEPVDRVERSIASNGVGRRSAQALAECFAERDLRLADAGRVLRMRATSR